MNIERQIEFDKVKDIWADFAVTDWAKEKIREAGLYFSESELRKQLRDTTDARTLIEKLGTPPLQNISVIREVLLAAEKGNCLTPYQLERVEKVLVAVKRLKDYLARGKNFGNSLAYYDENMVLLSELHEDICSKIRNGAVDDHASKGLEQIRKQIIKCEEQMKQKAEQILRSNKEYMADNYCTFRNGRICLPVKKDYKFKISGNIIDKSSTGSTLFIEPSGVAKYYEELQLLKISEENEVYSILYTLSAFVLASASVLYENLTMIEKLDFIFSKGKLSLDMEATEPAINTECRMKLQNARHPLMDKAMAVPLQFEAGESCAFYIANRLGMPKEMLRVAIHAAYGEEDEKPYSFQNTESSIGKKNTPKIVKAKTGKNNAELAAKYKIGDSVMVYPEKKIGSCVCRLTKKAR